MPVAEFPSNEIERLASLKSYHILDTLEEKDFDDLTELASQICGTPIALITFIDKDRQWFKSHLGTDLTQTHRDIAFCSHAIISDSDITEVPDAKLDDRFADNILVTENPNIVFYAGVPLVNEDGHALGTLCVLDVERKQLSTEQRKSLKTLAKQVMDKLELRKRVLVLEEANTEISFLNKRLLANERKLHNMIMAAPMGMTIFRGRDLIIEIANDPILKIWNRSLDTMIGSGLLDVFPELVDQPFPGLLQNVFDTGKPFASGESRAEVASADGTLTEFYLNFTYEPMVDEHGQVDAVLCSVLDITDIVLARKALEENEALLQTANEELSAINEELEAVNEELHATNEELLGTQTELQSTYEQVVIEKGRLGLAADITGMATIDIDLATDGAVYGEGYADLFDYEPGSVLKADDFNAMIHPADAREIVKPAMERALKTGEFSYDTRINTRAGNIKWIRVKGKVILKDGMPERTISTAIEITEQKQDEQRKNDFISMVSHELKTPLTSLKGFAQLLQMKAKKSDDGQTISILDRMVMQTNKMQKMISGFLNVSRLESGQLHLNLQEFELNELLTETLAEVAISSPNHSFNCTICDDVLLIADRDKISQVIENMLRNAVKYSPENTHIELMCARHDNKVKVSVKDEGIGINEQDIPKLFDRFYRVDDLQVTNVSGFGIGLYLSYEIIKKHNGQIWAESEAGKGTTFHFTLPLS